MHSPAGGQASAPNALDQISSSAISVDIWIDFVCPFSYLASSRIEAAVSRVDFPIQVEYHSFQLMPDLPEDYRATNAEFFRDYRGIPPQELQRLSQPLVAMTAEAELPYNLPEIQQASTLKAHQLLHYAKAHGDHKKVVTALFRAHFGDGLHIGTPRALLDIAKQQGFDAVDVERSLASEKHLEDVRRDTDRAAQMGIKVVPFFVLGGTHRLSGAQEVSTIVDALLHARN